MAEPIHFLTSPGELTASAVVCGDPAASMATWDTQRVTCPACHQGVRAPCTCGPGTATCAVCRQWRRHHRGDGSRKAPPEPPRFHHEQQFQEAIRRRATDAGFLYYHTHNSRTSPSGFPDTVLVRGTQLVFAELKMPGKTPSAAQAAWLDALGQVTTVDTHVWYPADLAQILEVLR